MPEAAKDATQTGATDEGLDQVSLQSADSAAVAAPAPTERELEMERIAEENLARRGVKVEPAAQVETQAADTAPAKKEEAAPAIDAVSQLSKQLEDGSIVLDDALLAKAMVRTKVDGKEELVPASKALGQYQKGAAADVRLAEATRLARENADLQAKLTSQLKPATTDAQKQEAAKQQAQNAEDLGRLRKEYVEAMYAGDDEKAGQLFDQMTDIRVQAALASREPAPAPVNVAELAQQVAPALKHQLSVDSALEKLFADYPEIEKDEDYISATDRRISALEAQGKPRDEAIALAGKEVAQKYGLGPFAKKDVAADGGLTTREQKLAAKERLDEPAAAAARAVNSTEQRIPTASEVIAEMASRRGQRAA